MKKYLINFKAIKKRQLLAWYESKRLLGHPFRLLFLLLLFFMLIFLGHSILGGERLLPTVIIVDEDQSIEVRTFVENVAYNKLKNVVAFEETSLEVGLDRLDSDQAIGVIHIPTDTRKNLDTLEPASMSLYINDQEDIRVQLLIGYMKDMVGLLNEGQSGAMVYYREMSRQGISYTEKIQALEDISIDYGLAFLARGSVFAATDVKDPLEGMLPIQYFGYGLIWLVLLITSGFGHSTVISDIKSGRKKRLLAAGFTEADYFFARLTNGCVFSFGWIMIVIFLFSWLLNISLVQLSLGRMLIILWLVLLVNGFAILFLSNYQHKFFVVLSVVVLSGMVYTSGLVIPEFYLSQGAKVMSQWNLINFGDNVFKGYPLMTWRSMNLLGYSLLLYTLFSWLSQKVVD